jgi:hypothetical protein
MKQNSLLHFKYKIEKLAPTALFTIGSAVVEIS